MRHVMMGIRIVGMVVRLAVRSRMVMFVLEVMSIMRILVMSTRIVRIHPRLTLCILSTRQMNFIFGLVRRWALRENQGIISRSHSWMKMDRMFIISIM